jgi:hypothetical protein
MTASAKQRRIARACLRALAGLYLVGLWLDAVGCSLPARVLPHAIDYFMEVAALFPEAAGGAIDYRAEGWVCSDGRWQEIDTRPYFPLDPDSKENRFQRALNFYRDDVVIHRALDDYLVGRHDAGSHDDGIPRDRRIGGVRLVRVKIPIPPPGTPLQPFTRRPLAELPKADKETLYRTPRARIDERCGPPAPPPEGASTAPEPE